MPIRLYLNPYKIGPAISALYYFLTYLNPNICSMRNGPGQSAAVNEHMFDEEVKKISLSAYLEVDDYFIVVVYTFYY